jgi:hypothetical protein
MGWNDQIKLIAQTDKTPRTDDNGFPLPHDEASTTVFADKKSVGYSEFYKAAQAGYTTELKFDVHTMEYPENSVDIPWGAGNGIAYSHVHARERRVYRVDAG